MKDSGKQWQTLAEAMRPPDPAQLLRDLTAEQTALLNANAPEADRIAVFQRIQEVQQLRSEQNRR